MPKKSLSLSPPAAGDLAVVDAAIAYLEALRALRAAKLKFIVKFEQAEAELEPYKVEVERAEDRVRCLKPESPAVLKAVAEKIGILQEQAS